MEAKCQCLLRRDNCINKCPVSRNSRLHERTCETCGLCKGVYFDKQVKAIPKVGRRKGRRKVSHN